MAELRETHLRYLLVIYELGRGKPDVGIQDIAKTLGCSKASATKMMGILMDMALLVRERYGKVYLTDTGFLLAKDVLRCVEELYARLPAMDLDYGVHHSPKYAGALQETAVRQSVTAHK